MSGTSTRLTRRIAAPPAAVYRALTDPVAVATWMVPDGMTSEVHRFEAREGGAFRITLTYDEPTGTGKTTSRSDSYHGRFLELVPDRRVVQAIEFESDDPSMQGEMRVIFTLEEADGGTLLSAAHEHVPPGIAPEDNELGWRMSLGKLARLLERG